MGEGNEERKIKDDAKVLSWDEWENSGRWWLKNKLRRDSGLKDDEDVVLDLLS